MAAFPMSAFPKEQFWVDTDFGFDDLWALLVLRHLGADIAGLSLVAGNAPLGRVVANALGARAAYGIDAPVHAGADRPLVRDPETAERILGPRGMCSRGRHLPQGAGAVAGTDADAALRGWLGSARPGDRRDMLAIGPLTNIARLVRDAPDLARSITRLVWMGGSDGPGNHSPQAEFNALADPDAAALVARAGLPLEVIDLALCRTVTFGPAHLPECDALTADLLGGYLDIGLSRGRAGMAIYDPVAALAACRPGAFAYRRCDMVVSTAPDATCGKTTFVPNDTGSTRLATGTTPDAAALCLAALAGGHAHGD